MFLYYFAGLTLLAFYLGFGIGLKPGRRRADTLPRGIPAMLIGVILSLGVFQAAKGNVGAPAAGVTVFGIMFLGALLALGGLGAFVGSLSTRLPLGGVARRLATGMAVLLPLAVVGTGIYTYETERRAQELAQAKARDQMQSETYSAKFGSHTVSFPGAPIIELRHQCRDGAAICTTMFWYSPGLNGATPETLKIRSFALNTQVSVLTPTNTWCADRPGLSSSVWCGQGPNSGVKLRAEEDLHVSERNMSLTCAERWEVAFACRSFYRVADGIVAELYGTGETQAEAEAATLAKRATADALWAALQSS